MRISPSWSIIPLTLALTVTITVTVTITLTLILTLNLTLIDRPHYGRSDERSFGSTVSIDHPLDLRLSTE